MQLEALSRQTYGGAWEVVIADNGSSDDTVEVARSFSDRLPALTVVDASDREGANHARNRGSAVARGDLIAFCDADDVVSVGWLEALAVSAERADQVGGAVELEVMGTGSPLFGRRPSPPEEPRLGFLPFASGSTFAIWKDVLEELGGMNEDYMACQDVELSWRLQLASKTLTFEPRALVHHRSRATLRAAFGQHYLRGVHHVLLYEDFREQGMPRSSGRGVLAWAWLSLTAPLALFRRTHRELWIRRLGLRVGRLAGSLRHGAFYP